LAARLEELLLAAERIAAGGNPHVILCERGIRTFETATRNTLDLSAVPASGSLRTCRSSWILATGPAAARSWPPPAAPPLRPARMGS
jgi:hypothetical protein